MCGRVIVRTTIAGLINNFTFAHRKDGDGLDDLPPRYNGSPRQEYPIIIHEDDVEGPVFVSANWGFVPGWMKDPKGGPRPINAKSETVATNGMFRHAYKSRRALMPIDGFFEWKAIKGSKITQPYAIAMKSLQPFCIAGIWDYWFDHELGRRIRTFCVLTCKPNELMATIHDRMPVILHPKDYQRWIANIEPDPNDLFAPLPEELMTMWPVSSKVGNPRNNAPDVVEEIPLPPTDLV